MEEGFAFTLNTNTNFVMKFRWFILIFLSWHIIIHIIKKQLQRVQTQSIGIIGGENQMTLVTIFS